jgi:hypothetical protein
VERSCGFWADHESVRIGIESMYAELGTGAHDTPDDPEE